MKFQENPPSCSLWTDGRTDGQTGMTKLTVTSMYTIPQNQTANKKFLTSYISYALLFHFSTLNFKKKTDL